MTAADAWIAAGAALACIAAIGVLVIAATPNRPPFGDTVPDLAPPLRYSNRRDAADDIEEA